jgi:1-acyl-sn-glycerol-3-phosphate acyltransferase
MINDIKKGPRLKTRMRLGRRIYNKYKELTLFFIALRYRFLRRLRFKYVRLLVYVGFRLWLKKIHNAERLPQKGPAIIVSNHTSYYDWSVLSAVYNREYLVFLGAQELLNRPIVSWLMKLNILIYIDRERPGLSYFREVVRRLKQGRIVVIYPEGKRSKSGKMIEPKTGFLKLAMLVNAPIIPIGMKGTYDILPPHKKIPRFRKCEIFVDEPIMVEENNPLFKDIFLKEHDGDELSDKGLTQVAVRIMDRIGKNVGQEWDDSFRQDQE